MIGEVGSLTDENDDEIYIALLLTGDLSIIVLGGILIFHNYPCWCVDLENIPGLRPAPGSPA